MDLEEYKAQCDLMSHRERAAIEAELYRRLRPKGWCALAKDGKRGGSSISDWLITHGVRGGGTRASIALLGDAAEPLWSRIEAGGLQLKRASKMAIEARRSAVSRGLSLNEAVANVLAAYDALPVQVTTRGGRSFRKTRNGGGKGKAPWRSATAEAIASPDEPSREFWAKLRAQVIARARLSACDANLGAATDLAKEFCRELDTLISTFQQKETHLRAQSVRPISRGQVIDACATLNHEEPGSTEDLSHWLKLAGAKKRKLAKLYHPDAHGGDESLRPEYQAVIEAYLVCEQYARERKARSSPRLVVIEGGQQGEAS